MHYFRFPAYLFPNASGFSQKEIEESKGRFLAGVLQFRPPEIALLLFYSTLKILIIKLSVLPYCMFYCSFNHPGSQSENQTLSTII
jgi:hypothetical protein